LRAVLCNGFEGIKALTIGTAPEPHPALDEVLVDVHAASVSYMDYLMICGGYQMRPPPPFVPGTDAAGVVVACGEKVKRFHPGDRVACENWFGGFAERMTAKASKTARLPDNTDFIVGSTLLHIYLTAWYALVDRARLQAGETVLVTGAQAASASLASNSRGCLGLGSSQPLEVPPRKLSYVSTAPQRLSTIRAKTSASG
jgi:NADPH2:quinone reductase